MGSWKGSSVAVAVAVAASAAFAAVASGSSLGQSASTVTVTAGKPSELAFTLSKKSAAKGLVTFTVTNKGKLSHDFKIAGKKTATISPGKTTALKVTFTKPGKYSFLCTVPGHAAAGMKGILTIK